MRNVLNEKVNFNEQIEKTIQKIEFSLDDEFTIEELASISGYSPFHFQRLFKKYVGENVAHYICRLRVERAALMLKYQNETVTNVGIRSGFACPSTFTRAFEKYYHISPKDFKEGYKHNFSNNDSPEFKVVRLDDFKVIFIRKCGRYDLSEPLSWKMLQKYYSHIISNKTKYISICYDEPSIVSNECLLRYDACILYDEKLHKNIKNIPLKTIKGGKYARFEFFGSLDEFNNFFNIVFDTFYHDRRYQISLKPSIQIHYNSYKNLLFGKTRTDLLIPLD